MRYVALGDSISVDDYTGVAGGGAASQLARLLGADEFLNLTRDGQFTDGLLAQLEPAPAGGLVTVTIGGNDLLLGRPAHEILRNVAEIDRRLAATGARVIANTVYDPSDGDDRLAETELRLPPRLRAEFDALNAGIRALADQHGFLLADLEQVFRGHGLVSAEPWYVLGIEPNLDGATAIAACWHALVA